MKNKNISSTRGTNEPKCTRNTPSPRQTVATGLWPNLNNDNEESHEVTRERRKQQTGAISSVWLVNGALKIRNSSHFGLHCYLIKFALNRYAITAVNQEQTICVSDASPLLVLSLCILKAFHKLVLRKYILTFSHSSFSVLFIILVVQKNVSSHPFVVLQH